MYAEACNELGEGRGSTRQAGNGARPCRRTVHPADMTVGLPEITETGKEKLREIIWNERRIELALEGHRFFDLIRADKVVPGYAEKMMKAHGEDKLLDSKTCNVLHPAEAGGYLAGSPQKLI